MNFKDSLILFFVKNSSLRISKKYTYIDKYLVLKNFQKFLQSALSYY